jgi:hypothetical protein
VSDIFREVEEDVRRERFEKLWKAYGIYAIVALVLLFAGIGGWQFWQRHELQERQKFSDSFLAAQRITNPQTAAGSFADLARTAPKGYRLMAQLSQAGAMFASGQRDGAIDLYKQIAKDDSGTIGSVARLRAAWASADTSTRNQLAELLKPFDRSENPWRQNAQEILAYADYRALDMKAAQTKYAALAADPQSPDALKARARAMADFIKNGGARDFGTVPPEALPVPPGAAEGAAAAAPPAGPGAPTAPAQ